MTRRSLFTWLAVLTLVILAIPARTIGSASAATPTPKVLDGTVPAAVAHAQLVGPRAAGDTMTITIGLSLRDEAALIQFLHDLNDPSSPNYHQYLSLAEANSLFNPTSQTEQQVTGWLQSGGLTVTHTYPNHLMIDAQGTVAQVSSLVHITINQYQATVRGKQQTFYAPDRNPTVDASVSDAVQSINGLDSYPRFHTSFSNGTARGAPPYYPQDLANAYDVTNLWNAGYTGSGQHIAITLWTVPPSDSTLSHFGSVTGAAVATTANSKLKVIKVDGGTTSTESPDQGEAGLDIETTSGIAPLATIDYYEAPTDGSGNPTDQGLLDALNQAGSDTNNNREINSSWGGCEASPADSWTQQAENIFRANAATGHNYFFSSGDNGSWCDPNGTGTGIDPYPDYPASSPNVTSVGGTRFSGPVGASWPGETAWTYCASCGPEGSGGGYSLDFSRPSWQTGTGLAANGKRGFPDISADADPYTGTYVCYGSSSSCDQFGGTSLSSPFWAGITALINQYLLAQSKPALGFLPPSLYTLAGHTQTYAPFHDVTSGTNGVYHAGSSWDAVTGLGTPDAWNIARDLAGSISSGGGGGTPPPSGLITNGSFESGNSGWTEVSGSGRELVTNTKAHTGSYSAWLCGRNSCNDQISQTITLPSSISTAYLTYWTYVDSTDATFCADTMTPRFTTTAGTTIVTVPRTCNGNLGWTQHTYNYGYYLSSHAGQQVKLSFTGLTNTASPTDFYIDDIALTTTAATATATPRPTATPTSTPTGGGGTTTSCSGSTCITDMLTMLNTDRSTLGVAALTLNLTQTNGSFGCIGSYGNSVYMAQQGAISHSQFPADICIKYTTAGENVGEAQSGNELADLQQLDSMMMAEPHSAGCSGNHACNIINPAFHQVGIGIYYDSAGRTWLTEDFTN